MRNRISMWRMALASGFIFGILVSSAPAATSSDLLKCQKTLESQFRSFTTLLSAQVTNCALKVVNCKLANEIDAVDATACLAAASTACSGIPTKISDAQTSKKGKILTKCGLIPLADLKQFIAGLGFFNVANACGAGDATALVDCVFSDGRCAIEHNVFVIDPRAQDSLTTAGIAASFPCVGP